MLLHVLLHFGNTNILTTSKEFCELFAKSLIFSLTGKSCIFSKGVLNQKGRNTFFR